MSRILRRELGIGVGVFVALASVGFGQGRPATASTLQTTPSGTVTTTTNGTRGAESGGGTENLVIGGALWTRSNPDWTPKVVSIGAQGTQVFSQIEFGQDHAELLSGFSPDPATPAWTSNVPIAGTNAFCESAETTDAHATVHQIVQNNNQSTRLAVVSRWRSGSTTPEWTWSFPGTTAGMSRVGISADGTRIVAATIYPSEMRLRLAVFQGSSGTPVYTGEITNFGLYLRGFEFAADGSTLYLASNGMVFIWNVTTHAVAAQFVLPGMFDSHAMSGDGRVFAWGEFNRYHVYERNAAGTYAQTFVRELPGSLVCDRLALSANGATLVSGWHYYDQNLRVRVEAMDVPSKAITMSDEAEGTGTYQNVVSAVSASDDGQRFAVGLWGDEAGLVPELRIYRRGQNAPVATYNYGGSVYDLAMSRAGDRVVVGVKSVHANLLAGGGSIDLYSTADEDFVAVGTPSIGRKVDFELWGAPNSPARLLLAPHPANNLFPIGAMGVLYLRRTELTILPMPATDSVGYTRGEYQLPLDPAIVGTTLWFQGLTTSPRRFTQDYVQLTILP